MPKGCGECGNGAERSAPQQTRSCSSAPIGAFSFDPRTLPQKAGCEPRQLGRIVAKELVDNALDAGADGVRVDGDLTRIVVRDNGPGIAPDKIATLFSVNRPLLSSKLKRLPTRGMLGNGLRVVMGAVVAFDGKLTVTSRRQRYELCS